MQLIKDSPTLGGLTPDSAPPSRRAALQRAGGQAEREIGALLGRARRRAVRLPALRAIAVLLAGLQIAVLAGAPLASVNGPLLARAAPAPLAVASAAAVGLFFLRPPVPPA